MTTATERVAIVTGANGAIGLAICKGLAKQDHEVVMPDLPWSRVFPLYPSHHAPPPLLRRAVASASGQNTFPIHPCGLFNFCRKIIHRTRSTSETCSTPSRLVSWLAHPVSWSFHSFLPWRVASQAIRDRAEDPVAAREGRAAAQADQEARGAQTATPEAAVAVAVRAASGEQVVRVARAVQAVSWAVTA